MCVLTLFSSYTGTDPYVNSSMIGYKSSKLQDFGGFSGLAHCNPEEVWIFFYYTALQRRHGNSVRLVGPLLVLGP